MDGEITSIGTIKGALAARASLAGSLSPPALAGSLSPPASLSGILSIPTYIDVDLYDGPTEVTPGEDRQVLRTANKTVIQDIIVNPIPSNYGLITWNGSTLTVS